jgi:SAM-dependent methyltransferase
MLVDKSLFFYGPIYHRLFDPQLAEARQVAVDLIAEGSSVLDIGCGTGLLGVSLAAQKKCRVVGLDLSLRMLEYARRSNPYPEVTFVHGDATDLSGYADRSFDYATLLMLVHELSASQQGLILQGALRVARRVIIIDAAVPLPHNAGGIGIRIVEGTFGRDHNPNFRAFLRAGGIGGMLGESAGPVTVDHRAIFWRNCREVVVVRGTRGNQPPEASPRRQLFR